MDFEKKLVKGLKASGVNVEYQKYDNYFIFSNIAKMDSNSPDIDNKRRNPKSCKKFNKCL